ncbi:MAG: translation initiation factor [Flavobacteriaceae bacterium]
MTQKLNRLDALAQIQFKNLEPDPDPLPDSEPDFIPQELEAHFSIKGRAGKTVTLIKGFQGETADLKALSKILKNKLKVGGTVKNGEILIQGNHRDALIQLVKEMGHKIKRIGG